MIPTLQLGGLGRTIKRPSSGGSALATFDPSATGPSGALSNANRTWTKVSGSGWTTARGVNGYDSGTHHVAFHIDENTGDGAVVGLQAGAGGLSGFVGSDSWGFGYYSNGNKLNGGGSSAYGATWTAGDVITAVLRVVGGVMEVEFFKGPVSQGVAFSGMVAASYGPLFPAGSVFASGNAVSIAASPASPSGSTQWE